MRRILFILLALIVVGAALVFIAPLFISTDVLQKQALAKIERATGYRVRIDGPVRIAVFPSLDLVAGDVGIAQPGSGGPAEFATARTLRFGLRASRLLTGKVQLTEVTLVDPVIKLPLPEGVAPDAAIDGEERQAVTPQDLSLDELRLRNGTVILPEKTGEPGKRITSLNVEATLPRANGPLTFDARARYDGDRVSAAGSIGSFAHFIDGGSVPIELALQTPDFPDGVTLTGAASYKDSVFKLAHVVAQSGPHKLSGNAIYRDDTLSITQGVFDDTPFSGTGKLDGETLTADIEVVIEDKPVRVAGSLGNLDQVLVGGETQVALRIAAPDRLEDEATLEGAISYKNDVIALPNFAATLGEDSLSGTAVYEDDVLSLNQVTATLGDQTITGNATYRNDLVDLDASTDLDGKPAKVTGSITGIEKLLDGEPAPIDLVIDAPDKLPAQTSVAGNAFYEDDTLVLTGFTAVSGDYRLTGDGTYKDDVLALDPIKIETGSQALSGNLTANLAGDVPDVNATLTATGTLMSKGGAAPAPQQAPQERGAAKEAAKPQPQDNPSEPGNAETAPRLTAEPPKNPIAVTPGSESDIAAQPAPREPESGKTDQASRWAPAPSRTSGFGWRMQKLGFLTLKEVNANATLTLDQFVFEGIRIRAATVNATLTGGKLTAESKDLKAYGGGGSVTLVLDASGAVPAHRLNLAVSGLDAYPFLNDVADFRTIKGEAAIVLSLTASGDSERAIVSSLSGTAKFEFTNGALRGLNVTNMLRNLTTGILTGWQYKQETKTAFNKLSASFKITNGKAQTEDLRMVGPLVSIGGAGMVDLPAQRLKFRVNPFMLVSVEGQSGKNNILGFPVPIAISGPWDNPAIYPDIVGVLENPVAAYQKLNKLGGGLISVPASMLGIDTGEGGLVEQGIAIPGAITKGVVGGIGEMLGGKNKKRNAAPAEKQSPTAANGNGSQQELATDAAPNQQGAPKQQDTPKQQTAPTQQDAPKQQAAPKQEEIAPAQPFVFGD